MKKIVFLFALMSSLTSFAYDHPTCEYKIQGYNSMEEVEELFDRVDRGDFLKLLKKRKLKPAKLGELDKKYILLNINIIKKNVYISLDAGNFQAVATVVSRKPAKAIANFLLSLPKCNKRK